MEQLRSGKPLFDKDGALAPLLKEFLEAVMEGELYEHLDDAQRENGTRKNGRTPKRLKTADGTIDIETPGIDHQRLIRKLSKSGKRSLFEYKIIGSLD